VIVVAATFYVNMTTSMLSDLYLRTESTHASEQIGELLEAYGGKIGAEDTIRTYFDTWLDGVPTMTSNPLGHGVRYHRLGTEDPAESATSNNSLGNVYIHAGIVGLVCAAWLSLARRHVTVSLSGDGGDEVFGGYTRYQWADAIWRKSAWLSIQSRRHIAKLLASVPHRAWRAIFRMLAPLLPRPARQTNPADKLQKLAEILLADSPEALYYGLVSQWSDPTALVLGASELPTALTQRDQWAAVPDFFRRMMFLDIITYLPDDILVKLDRATMGVSLESRVPFLDHRIIEFSWRLPLAMKIRGGRSKWLLRQVLRKYVPPALVDRPKSGFGIPIHDWLRGPLRQWAEELLDVDRLQREKFFDPAPIRRKWIEHLSGKHNRLYPLWNVLMFQAWLEHERAQRSDTVDASPLTVSAPLACNSL